MQMMALEVQTESAQQQIDGKYAVLFSSLPQVHDKALSEIEEWQREATKRLILDSPFSSAETKLNEWELIPESKLQPQLYVAALKDYQQFCSDNNSPFEQDFWRQKFSLEGGPEGVIKLQDKRPVRAQKNQKVSFKLLLAEWRKKLDKAEAQWRIEYLAKLRAELIKRLEAWLDLLASLSVSLESLGLDPGIWVDMSSGTLSPGDIAALQRWARYLTEDPGAKSIADLLGKMHQIEQSEKIEQVTKSRSVQLPSIDINSRQEIRGIKLAREIEYALPSELALLSDPDTSILFDIKYLEERLLCFEMQGETYREKTEEYLEDYMVPEDDQKGPMILCIDTSGSMSGTPESIAKAMALHLATLAKSQNRQCYLINFSTGISTYEFSADNGLEKLLQFLQQSFHGGTDVAPALRHALDLMETEAYKKSDLLIISDFIMAGLSDELLERLELQRALDNQFNSLVVGDCFMSKRLKTHFDNEWVFNPDTGQIIELINFKQELALSA